MIYPAVILAAGASTRLGSPKQVLLLHGETLLDRTVRTAREAGCTPIHVILGANALIIQQSCNLAGATVHLNRDWPEGMASSLRLGIEVAGSAEGVLILTCDQPAVTPAHLRSLAAHGTLTASSYAGRHGVPAFLPAATFPQISSTSGDKGARDLLLHAPAIHLEHGEIDIDTTHDVHLLLTRPLKAIGGDLA